MPIETLKDIYIDQMQDIFSANIQAIDATKKLLDKANDEGLQDALKTGLSVLKDNNETLRDIIKSHDKDPNNEFCKGMQGLVKEVDAHVLDAEFSDDNVCDAMIITQYQRMTHYALAGYGCIVAFAKRLNLNEEAQKLNQCLDSTYDGDREMTRIAEGHINQKAAA